MRRSKLVLALILTLVLQHPTRAAAVLPAPADSTSSCATDLDRLDRKVQEDYAGFLLEVRGEALTSYHRLLDSLRIQAATIEGERCYFVLQSLISRFHDPHLFIYQSARLDTAETARRAQAVERLSLTEAEARAYFTSHRARLDPIEGIWYDRELRVAVMRPPGVKTGPFLAVVIRADTSIWAPGEVRARFTPRSDGGYDGVVWERNFAFRNVDARVHKRALLRLSPGMWGKEFPLAPGDSGLVDRSNAHRATLMTRGGTLIVSIPSHDPTYLVALDSLLRAYRKSFETAERMIVDLRGNEGGSAGMTDVLMPFVASDSQKPPYLPDRSGKPDRDAGFLLSSPDQIEYAMSNWLASDTMRPRSKRLLERLRANPGKLVPIADSLSDSFPRQGRDSVIYGPKRVGILIDGGTVSAAEAFLLRAMRSTRVTVFGEPTEGALDYQSVNIVRFQATGRRWWLGYPTITAHPDLPTDGMRGKGIRPDIPINLQREADPIGVVDRALKRPGPGG